MMIKMKKAILCIFMCLVLMLSFAACKNKDGSSDTTRHHGGHHFEP